MKNILLIFILIPAMAISEVELRIKSNYEGGVDAYNAGNTKMAVILFTQGAEKGEPDSQAALGTHYYFGDGVEKDIGKAISLFKKSAKSNEPLAHSMLGTIYQQGSGVASDQAKAFYHARKAAFLCIPQSQNQVAHHLYEGSGSSRDKPRALAWLYVADKLGSENAKGGIAHISSELSENEVSLAQDLVAEIENEITCG